MWWMVCSVMTALPADNLELRLDESVVFHTTAASFDPATDVWTIPIRGVLSTTRRSRFKQAAMLAVAGRWLRFKSDEVRSPMFRERMGHFLAKSTVGRSIGIRLGSEVYPTEISGNDGHFRLDVRLSDADVRRLFANDFPASPWVSLAPLTADGDQRAIQGAVQLLPAGGLSVISDIDDTIRETQVDNHRAMLANTFLRDFEPVGGMSDVYQTLADHAVAFHYVSGSPWQLYAPLQDFLHVHKYPSGTFHLRKYQIGKTSTEQFTGSQVEAKTAAIAPLLKQFPQRRFVLIGDSGQQDPEIYGDFAREYPDQVVGVFIRLVQSETRDSDRLRQASRDVPAERWHLFTSAEDIGPTIFRLVQRECGSADDRSVAP